LPEIGFRTLNVEAETISTVTWKDSLTSPNDKNWDSCRPLRQAATSQIPGSLRANRRMHPRAPCTARRYQLSPACASLQLQ
jgi:hypothetical protein